MEGNSKPSKDTDRQRDEKNEVEAKMAEQREYFNNKIANLEKELRKMGGGKKEEVEFKYDRLEKKINDKLTILEDKMMNLTIKFSEESRERKKETISRNNPVENEDVSSEINNLYSVINKKKDKEGGKKIQGGGE